jgi:hypothetical protein
MLPDRPKPPQWISSFIPTIGPIAQLTMTLISNYGMYSSGMPLAGTQPKKLNGENQTDGLN